ncbi:MAG: M48 family metalloprotease [Chloroflexi bacterium]|nr:M48 family metalloprotease [Chloroflexota bacterium]
MRSLGNLIKTGLLLLGMVLVFLFFGYLLGGTEGMFYALIISVVMSFVSWFQSGQIAIQASRAMPISEGRAPQLHTIIENLAQRADIPKPDVYIVPSEIPNAFATGRTPGAAKVAVTQGIVDMLDQDELAGVLAHEISHVDNWDITTSSVAAALAGALTFLARSAQYSAVSPRTNRRSRVPGGIVLLAVLAPIAAAIIQFAISRTREFAADEEGARILGDPNPLADALQKMERYSAEVQDTPSLHSHPAMAHMWIIAPAVDLGSLSSLFRTHPPTEERIRRLRNMNI